MYPDCPYPSRKGEALVRDARTALFLVERLATEVKLLEKRLNEIQSTAKEGTIVDICGHCRLIHEYEGTMMESEVQSALYRLRSIESFWTPNDERRPGS